MQKFCKPVLLALSAGLLFSHVTLADTLVDIYELSLNNDPTIRAAEASYRAGQEAVVLGRSGILPQIAASADYSHLDNENYSTLIEPEGINRDIKTDATGWGVNLSQPLFDMPAWFTFQQGKSLTGQAGAQFAADQQDLIIRVSTAYFNVLRAIDNLKASQAQEAANKRQLEQTQQRFDVGLIAITDVHEAQASYDLAVATRLGDQGNLGISIEVLSVLTGQPHSNIWLLKEDYPIENPDPAGKDEWVAFAMENNQDIKVATFARDAAESSAQSAKAVHYPTLDARLGYNDNRNDIDDNIIGGYDSNQKGSSIALSVNLPLYAGGGISASSRQAYELYNRAVELYAGTTRTTVQKTRALHIQVSTDVARTKARKQAVVSSRSALDATQAGYEVGTRNIVDVLTVQQNLYSAIRDYSNTRYDYVINMLNLKQSAGTLSPQDIYDLNGWLTNPPAPTASSSGQSK